MQIARKGEDNLFNARNYGEETDIFLNSHSYTLSDKVIWQAFKLKLVVHVNFIRNYKNKED